MDVSIIIVSWNTKELLLDCIASAYRTVEKARFEIIVSDNGSRDGSLEAVAERYPAVRRIENGANLGFGRANNIAIERMRGRYALLLNSDTVLKPGAVDRLFDFMESRPDAGMCGPQLLNADGSLQTSCGAFPTIATEFLGRTVSRLLFPPRDARPPGSVPSGPAEADFIIGACMMVRGRAMEAVGTLDPDYFFFYEEIDWCWRMGQAGWPVWFVPEAEVVHLGGGSMKDLNLRARAESWRSRYIFLRKRYRLSRAGAFLLHLAGFVSVSVDFLVYGLLNAVVLFSRKRLRRRWAMFGYLAAWHLAGFPVSMGLPR